MDHAAPTSGIAHWLELSDGPIYTVLHSPDPGTPAQPTAVLMIPPFGWDEVTSHRARRYWAIRLAHAGFTALRIDLPGSADSHGDPHLPDLVDRWCRSVREAAAWLVDHSGATRLAAIAVGTGGLIACRALAEGAPIDDLVLWAVKGKGRAAVRELVAYAGIVASEHPEDRSGPAPGDGIDVTGFLLTDATMAALSGIDVAGLSFPTPGHRRALLLSRDDLGVDDHLARSLSAAGIAVESVAVEDYAALMAHPQSIDPRRPEASIALTNRWLSAAPAGAEPAPGRAEPAPGRAEPAPVRADPARAAVAPALTRTTILRAGDVTIRETILNISLGRSGAVAIVSEPAAGETRAPVTALLLNSGALRKVGVHRMWTELARRWAARGIVTVRADFGAVGDAVGNDGGGDERDLVTNVELSAPHMLARATELIGLLRRRGLPERFVIVGHCSGAYLGFHAAVRDPGVEAIFAINLPGFVYDAGVYQERMLARIKAAARDGVLKRLREQGLSGQEIRQVLQALAHRYSRRPEDAAELRQRREGMALLDRLSTRDVAVLLLFAQEGALHADVFAPTFQAEIARGRWPNACFEELPTADHMARAIWIQKLTHTRLDAAVEQLLSARGSARAVSV